MLLLKTLHTILICPILIYDVCSPQNFTRQILTTYVTVLDNRYAHYQQTSSCWSKEYIGTRIDTSKFSLLTTNRWLKENTSQLLLVIHPIHLYLTSVLKCQVPPPFGSLSVSSSSHSLTWLEKKEVTPLVVVSYNDAAAANLQ